MAGPWLKQSTAVTIKFGPFVDSGDGNTDETALTIKKADVRLSKNGGNMVACATDQGSGDAGAAHDDIGYYDISLGTGDTDTLGRLKVMVHKTGALHVWEEYMVVPANVWDSMFGADTLKCEVVEISGDTTAADNLEAACDNYSATRGLSGTALPDAAADAAGGLPISDAGGLDLDTYIKRLEAAFTATIAGRIDAAISTRAAETGGNVADIKTTIGAAGAGLTAITGAKLHADYDAAKTAAPAGAKMDLIDAPNATAVTAIQSGLATAVKLLAYVKSILRKDQAADADIAGTYDATTDSLQAIRDTEPMGTAMRGTDGANTTTPPSTADIKTAMEGVGSHLTLIKTETDKLATAMEADGAVSRFTANALEQAPTGSGSGASLVEIEGSMVLAKAAALAAVAADVDTIDAKVSALGASVVTVTSPVNVDASTVTLVCGDDYYDADGRALTFTDSGGTYPAFTAGSCKFTVRDLAKGTDTETAGTIVDANTVRFELTKTATGAWTAGGKYRFDVEVTLASGHEVTIATGVVTMLAKYSG